MLERSVDVAAINRVVNHPDVRPFIGPISVGSLDLSEPVSRPENWFLMGEHGGFMLAWSAPKTREVHTFVLPSGRGTWAAAARQHMLEYAKDNGTQFLWTKIDPDARHVVRFARQGGMQPTGEVVETFGKDYRVFGMELV